MISEYTGENKYCSEDDGYLRAEVELNRSGVGGSEIKLYKIVCICGVGLNKANDNMLGLSWLWCCN